MANPPAGRSSIAVVVARTAAAVRPARRVRVRPVRRASAPWARRAARMPGQTRRRAMPAAIAQVGRKDRRWRDADFREGASAPGERDRTWRVGGED